MEMIKRTKEQRSIELLQGLMKQDYAVDSANLDILEDLIEQAKKDEDSKLADYDPIMYAFELSCKGNLRGWAGSTVGNTVSSYCINRK